MKWMSGGLPMQPSYRNYSNNNIDKEKSYLNYSLKEPQYSYENKKGRIKYVN